MKKKIVSCILSIITVFTLCAGTIGASAAAAPAPYTVTVSGKTVKFEKNAGSYIKNSRLMVGAMPAIMAFILMNSGIKLLRTFSQYVPPIIFFMNND